MLKENRVMQHVMQKAGFEIGLGDDLDAVSARLDLKR